MQSQDFTCSECQKEFISASGLLKHFALHAINSSGRKQKKTKIPDLYPINEFNKSVEPSSEVGNDSNIEDAINPLKFCLVTMEANEDRIDKKDKPCNNNSSSHNLRKYQCNYCLKRFGWSTDLKRHILTHTGEKPFPCPYCDLAFTRNFLLLKHQKKCHDSDANNTTNEKNCSGLPELTPITKMRKQEKCKIKRKVDLRNDHSPQKQNNRDLMHAK